MTDFSKGRRGPILRNGKRVKYYEVNSVDELGTIESPEHGDMAIVDRSNSYIYGNNGWLEILLAKKCNEFLFKVDTS